MAANLVRLGRRILQTALLIARYYFFTPIPVLEREIMVLMHE